MTARNERVFGRIAYEVERGNTGPYSSADVAGPNNSAVPVMRRMDCLKKDLFSRLATFSFRNGWDKFTLTGREMYPVKPDVCNRCYFSMCEISEIAAQKERKRRGM